MNTANNKRRQHTREKIEKIFVELLQERDISKITVSDICSLAEINRSTFYTNYEDIYALADSIRIKLEADVTRLYESDITNKYNSNDYLRLFRHIKDNQLFYKTYFKLGYDKKHVIDIYDFNDANRYFFGENIEYHIEFFKAGFNAIVQKWLDGGCKESPEEMNKILESEYQGRT